MALTAAAGYPALPERHGAPLCPAILRLEVP